jgi:hypothetical protein
MIFRKIIFIDFIFFNIEMVENLALYFFLSFYEVSMIYRFVNVTQVAIIYRFDEGFFSLSFF